MGLADDIIAGRFNNPTPTTTKKKKKEESISDSIINGTLDNNKIRSVASTIGDVINTANDIRNSVDITNPLNMVSGIAGLSSKASKENIKKAGGDLVNLGVETGKGVFDFVESGIYDPILQASSSKYNPGMYIADDNKSGKDKAKDFGQVLLGDLGKEAQIGMAVKDIISGNPIKAVQGVGKLLNKTKADDIVEDAYKRNKSSIDSKQAIAQELISDNSAQRAIDDTLGYGKVLSDGRTVQQTLDDNANLIKSDNIGGKVVRGIGRQIPSMMVGANVGEAGSLGTMALSSYGGGLQEAYQNGATREEANRYGLATTAVETATEKMFAGFGGVIGKGPLDDSIQRLVNDKIKNKVAAYIVNYGLDMLGEGVEEVAADILNPIAKKLTYASEADLKKLYEDENFLEDFLIGSLSSGVMKLTSAPFEISNMNQQIQQERQQNLNNQQNNLQQVQQQELQPNQVQNLPTQEVLQENNQTPIEQQTPQITPLNEVRNNDIADTVRAMNLEEQPSFKQKQGNYVYEVSDNSKIDNLRKDAANYFKEGEQTTNFVNTLEKIIEDKDIEIRFDPKLGNNVNGIYKNGVITLNPNSNRAGEFLAIHELTHAIGTKSMIDMIQTYRKSNAEFNSAVERLLSTYNTTEINEEALGDIAGQLFGNQEYINNLSMENPSLFKRIYNEIKYLWHQFTGYKNQDQFIEDLRNKWESAYRNSKAKQTNKIGYSINGDGRDFFYRGQQKEGTDLSYNDTQFQGSEDDGYYFTPNKKTANKYGKNIIERFRDENNTVTVEESDRLQEMATKKLEEHTKEGKWYEEDDLLEQMALGRSKAFAEYTGKPFVETGDMFGEDAEAVYYPEFDKDTKYSIEEVKKEPTKDNTGRELSEGQQKFVKDNAKELFDNKGRVKTYYHTTTNEVEPFSVFNPVGTPGYKYGDIVVNFYTDNPVMSGSYADSDYAPYNYDSTEKAKYQYKGYISMKNPYVIDSENRTYGKANLKANKSASKVLNILNNLSDETINELAQIKQEAREKQYNQEKLANQIKYLREGFDKQQQVAIQIGEILDATEKYNLDKKAQERNNRLIQTILEREGFTNEWDLDNLKYEYYKNDLGIDLSRYGLNKEKITLKDFLELENKIQAENKFTYEFFDDMLEDHRDNKQIAEILDTTFDVKRETGIISDTTGNKQYGRVSDLVYDAIDYDGKLNKKYLTKEGLSEHYVVDGFINQNTNDVIREVLEMNKNGSNYDGVIFKNLYDYGGATFGLDSEAGDVVVTFNSNQFKDYRNLNPTEDPDIRYSKDNQTWREYLEKEFPSQGTRTNLQDINERNKPKQENKTTQEEKPQEMPKNEVKQEVKKNYLTSAEQQELDGLKALDESGLAENKDLDRIKELERKQQGITTKYSDLKTNNKYEDIKNIYGKYKNNEISKQNKKVLQEAKNIIEANKQGRRTIEEWKQVAEYIGSNANINSSQDLQKLAIETWFESKPNNAQNLNRQGKKYVPFAVQDWVNSVYKGAGVGTDVKMSIEEGTDTEGNKIDLKPTKKGTYERVNTPKTKEVMPKIDFENKTVKIGNKNVSNFYSNVTEKSKFIDIENRLDLMNNKDIQYYDAISNKETLKSAMKNLDKNSEQAIGDFFTKEKFTPEDVATGWILVKRYQDAGNFEAMSKVLEKMREQGTQAGQTVQMYGILQRLTPEGMEYYAQKQLDNAYKEFSQNKSKKQIEKYVEDFTLTAEEHQFIKDQMEKVEKLTDDEAKKVEIAKVVKMLSDKMPPSKGSRLKAIMRLSMLGNPKTQVRNVVGNAIIQPVNWGGDVFATVADKIIAKKTGVRTKGLTQFDKLAKGSLQGLQDSIRDAKTGVDTRDIDLNRFEDSINAKPFYENHKGKGAKALNTLAKTLNKTSQALTNVMSGGDRIFYQAVFNNSLENQMRLNKVDTPTQDMIEIAKQEALSRTWNDSNAYTDAVIGIRRYMNKLNVKGYGLGDVLIPFAKTPANLTKAIVDYSPVGLARTILQDGRNLRNSLENEQYSPQLQQKFVDSLGKGTAGTILWALAYAAAQAGIVTGASDDDKDVSNFMRNTLGIQPYSIKIGNKSFTYDWAQPIAAPFAAMADAKKLSETDQKELASTIKSMANSSFSILMEQSFLRSISEVFNNYDGPFDAIMKQIEGLPARAVPTFFKQIADLIDPTSRQTYLKGNEGKMIANQAQVKIPGASKKLTANRDTLGREIKKYGGDDNKLQYAFNVFLNPANTNKGKVSEAGKEIYEVYKATKDKGVMPRQANYSESIGGETRNLTAEERNRLQKASGEMVEKNVKQLSKNSTYNSMSDEDKAEVIKGIVNYSFAKAKSEEFDVPLANIYSAADKAVNNGTPLYDYYIEKNMNNEIKRKIENKTSTYMKEMKKSTEYKNLTRSEKDQVERKVQYYTKSVTNSEELNKPISRTYKAAYNAEQNGMAIYDYYISQIKK